MIAEIISIGDELLIGQVINTNASWMGELLNRNGINVKQIKAIADDKTAIFEAINASINSVDLILLTGGLGPTKDDITKHTLCEYFDTKLVFNDDAFARIKKIFRFRNFEVTDVNKAQAELPESCMPIINSNGTASGMWFEKNGKVLVSMPGVPFEMKPMMENEIIPLIKSKYKTPIILHKTIMTQGVGESFLAKKIEDWEDSLPSNIKLAYLPQPGIVRLRLSAIGDNSEKCEKYIAELVEKLKLLIGDIIFGYDDILLEEAVGQSLKLHQKTVATAESCTGGYIAHLFTSIAGSSDYYKGSSVTYANEIKEKMLDVSKYDIEKEGAVSETVVKQMALGALQKFGTDYAIATSGIAGPDGGTLEKPIGTTWIAIAGSDGIIAEKHHFGEHRGRNIRRASLTALFMLKKVVEGITSLQ
ncbi:MAG: competence/damage-inducible protein A [Bacteroidales bacterium]|jgi:nicotinamide-nucleotide amidase|nr:competence/damage-inducible protein A [Bacteroidales bacterium]